MRTHTFLYEKHVCECNNSIKLNYDYRNFVHVFNLFADSVYEERKRELSLIYVYLFSKAELTSVITTVINTIYYIDIDRPRF